MEPSSNRLIMAHLDLLLQDNLQNPWDDIEGWHYLPAMLIFLDSPKKSHIIPSMPLHMVFSQYLNSHIVNLVISYVSCWALLREHIFKETFQ